MIWLLILIVTANILFFWDVLKKGDLLNDGLKVSFPWSFLWKHLTPNGYTLACFGILIVLNGIAGLIYYLLNIPGAIVFYAILTTLDIVLLTKDEKSHPKMPT